MFEHVLEQDLAFREIYRVLKPGGVSLHNFPSRFRPIEPHIFVPFGGVFHSNYYFLFWATMGIRNQFQKGLPAREVARRNHDYARLGINYLGGAELDSLVSAIFDRHTYQELAFLKWSRGRSRILYRPALAFPLVARLYRFAHTRVLLLEKRAQRPASDVVTR